MPNDCSVVADPAHGAAMVAGTPVAMSAAGANGALRFGGAAGSVLRPLTFGERTELVSSAAGSAGARDAVAAAVLGAATVEPGAGDRTVLEVLAMWLAGAAWDAPGYTESTLLVARAAGWPPRELFETEAREVDRLAVHLDEQRRASEWKSLVFAEPPAPTIDAVRARFADRLLRRSGTAAQPSPPGRAPESRRDDSETRRAVERDSPGALADDRAFVTGEAHVPRTNAGRSSALPEGGAVDAPALQPAVSAPRRRVDARASAASAGQTIQPAVVAHVARPVAAAVSAEADPHDGRPALADLHGHPASERPSGFRGVRLFTPASIPDPASHAKHRSPESGIQSNADAGASAGRCKRPKISSPRLQPGLGTWPDIEPALAGEREDGSLPPAHAGLNFTPPSKPWLKPGPPALTPPTAAGGDACRVESATPSATGHESPGSCTQGTVASHEPERVLHRATNDTAAAAPPREREVRTAAESARSQPAEFASSSAALLASLPELFPEHSDFPTVREHGQPHATAAAAAAALRRGDEIAATALRPELLPGRADLAAVPAPCDVLECGSRSCRFCMFEHGHAQSHTSVLSGDEAPSLADDIALTLALLLDDEADLRGVDR